MKAKRKIKKKRKQTKYNFSCSFSTNPLVYRVFPRKGTVRVIVGDFRFDYEYEIEYENDFSILDCRLHIITTQTYLVP